MYGSHGQFDGNAAFSGGGFMPSQATQTANDSSFSPAKSRDMQTLTPLTVKQISAAFQSSDDRMNIVIDGADVNNVKLVGTLMDKASRVTDAQFVLDDGTGRINCFRWLNGEAYESQEMDKVEEGKYVVVHGHLKGFQGKKQLVAYSVRPVSDYNEITNHFADCIYVHCHNTRLRRLQDNASSSSVQMPSSGLTTPVKAETSQFSGRFAVDGRKSIDGMILDYLQQPKYLNLEKGIHIDELKSHLGVPLQQIKYVSVLLSQFDLLTLSESTC
ncbi:OLC1v1034041C6 [Oldenlandia corymbosa var. corymbosa]|uniref:OLC1v1034041C6 n=1 Tax=Oldenlandia corymbosa var. corymbosa TaxID=529605 RepID=A0AAV1CPM4_OLDCO|nr:OLC1v1034041C6 [Oldenlandia corymbosa var. corymbosa]